MQLTAYYRSRYKKLLVTMLTMGLLLIGMNGMAQKLTISKKNIPFEKLLREIRKQTGFNYVCTPEWAKEIGTITLDVKNASIEEVLNICLSEKKFTYNISNKTITIYRTPAAIDPGPANTAPSPTLAFTGTVFNAQRQPLDGASVMVQRTRHGTITNAKGQFTLPDGNPGDILNVSFIGYKTKNVTVPPTGRSVLVILEEASNELDLVVAQGYSKTTRRLSTSSVSKVSSAEIERQPVNNALLALQGRVPGMIITPQTGYDAGPIKMEIRGLGMINELSAANPLIIIDGTPLTMGINSMNGPIEGEGPAQGFVGSISPIKSQSPLFGLNPRDIESIEVLKDISSTAIYGSMGANGVILITTKRGKPGQSQFNVNVNTGFSKIRKYWDMLSTPEYLEMRREAFRNDGIIPTRENAPDLLVWDTTRYTNWQKVFWGRTGKSIGANLALSGGVPQFTHRFSANYSRFEDITTTSGASERMGVGLALDKKSIDNKFMVGFTANYNYTRMNVVSLVGTTMNPPNAPPLFDKDGKINYKEYNDVGLGAMLNFAERFMCPVDSRTNSLSTNLKLSYQAFKGFNLSLNLGYNQNFSNQSVLSPSIAKNPQKATTGDAAFSRTNSNSWAVEPQANYMTNLFGLGRLNVLAGATLRSSSTESISDLAAGFTNDALLRNLANAAFVQSSNTSAQYKFAGIRSRAEYVWDNKYIVNFSVSRDGSSRFGPGSRFGTFWSTGLAWIPSDEPWFGKTMPAVFNYVKFRANFGTSGNDGGSDFQYMSRWGRGDIPLQSYDGVAPFMLIQAVNQQYQWQVAKEVTAAMEMHLLKNANIKLEVVYYNRWVSNQLLQSPTPVFTGFAKVFGNWNATVRNTGLEASLSAELIRTKDFSWTMSANGAINHNKLVRYPDIEKSPHYRSYLVGTSLGTRYLLNYIGVDPMTGTYKLEDYNKNGKVDNPISQYPPLSGFSDAQMAVLMMPEFTGGFGSSMRYKSLSLNLYFDVRVQRGINAFASLDMPGNMRNIPVEVFNNRWQKPGDQTKYAKFSTGTSTANYLKNGTTLAITDASFLRLTNINFSYSVNDQALLRKFKMKGLDLNISAQNLFVITKYEGIDPELQSFGGMPRAKTINVGVSLTF